MDKKERGIVDGLIEKNRRLVYTVLNRHYPHKTGDEDYIQIGTIGLWRAAESYREGRGRFSTYAYACILRELSAQDRLENRRKRKAETVFPSLDEPDGEAACQLPPDGGFEDRLLSRLRVDELMRELRLRDPRRFHVLARRMKGRSCAEIAEELHLTRQRVYQLCRDTGLKLRDELREEKQ